MDIKANAHVLSTDGKDLGHARRVVIDPRNGEIKDIVVRMGTLVTEDLVVPIEYVAKTMGDNIQLTLDADGAKKLDVFEETFYLPANGEGGPVPTTSLAPSVYWYPPMIGSQSASYSGAVPPEQLGYQLHKERHIPLNTVALKEGATVKSSDDHEIGKLEQVVTAPGTDQATHIVATDGLLHKTRKVIPLDWVEKIEEKRIHLAVPARVVENLPVYEN